MTAKPEYNFLNNSRFYVLSSSVLISLLVFAVLRLQISSDQLFYIRAEQIFGLLAIVYWYIALIISPIGHVIGKRRISGMVFARRAIGVSAAYFALLHFIIALWGQLGGIAELGYLPTLFKWSLAAGGVGLIVLLMMAATSFDVVIRRMTFKRWKWLHRLGYVGLVLVVLHVWTVGTHISYGVIQWIAFALLVVLAGLETYRITKIFTARYTDFQSKDYFFIFFFTIWIVWVSLIASIPAVVQNYHGQRHASQVQNDN